MWGRRRQPEPTAELAELVELVQNLGVALMGIDAKLEVIIDLMEGDDDEADRAD